MNSYKTLNNIVGWIVFAITTVVYVLSAERTGSLWDCGEFISGAYKLQVVHPPGAPFFLLVGRMFTVIAKALSNDPASIALSVNIMSGICSALAATFICWSTIILGKLALNGRDEEPTFPEYLALAGAGIVAGLCTAWATSVWFSAVEGEVYGMSTFFTAMTMWAVIKWYNLPNTPQADRWILFAVYAAGLSIGVHLLSLLTFPALALFYYFKKYQKHTITGMFISAVVGVAFIIGIQALVITGIPRLWGGLEIFMVNYLGLPCNLSLFPLLLIIGGALYFGFRYAHRTKNSALQNIMMGLALTIISFSTIGVVVIRANANPPINMNNPSDPLRLIPYLNREQYGERPLLYGPGFAARPIRSDVSDRYGRVGDHYEITERKVDYVFDPADEMLFPRMGHYEEERAPLYKRWMGLDPEAPVPPGRPNQVDNMSFLFKYQIGWMYWRYFFWNFSGRQNGDQGFEPWDKSSGHWLTGFSAIDSKRLYDETYMPDTLKNDMARNKYYMLPFIFGLFGLLFHYNRRREDFVAILALFIITGIGIIIYSNEPPQEPRERDYVLVGSIFTYCIWIGMGVLAMFDFFRKRLADSIAAPLAGVIALSAPLLMVTQNFDNMSRATHYATRDYASNFLNSCEPNSIIFTYGDNDTYPLWYAQEVEGIRTDVRVVNLSLIAVDWYIDQLRRKINNSPAIKLTIPSDKLRGYKRNQVPFITEGSTVQQMSLQEALKFIAEDHPVSAGSGIQLETFLPTNKFYIDVDKQKALANHIIDAKDDSLMVNRMEFSVEGSSLIKDDIAVLDIIGSNIMDRPIYFAVTCRPDKLEGMADYMQLEGLAMRIVPIKTPSDPTFGIIGSGRVNDDKSFSNITTKFKWGNFDKVKTFIDRSYMPSVQSIRFVMLRTALDMLRKKDNARAVALIDQYFKAFPHMNFPYDYNAMYMINVYLEAGAYDKAKPHIQILAKETAQFLKFYASLDQETLESSFAREYAMTNRAKDDMIRGVDKAGDTAYKAELEKLFAPYKTTALPPGRR